MTNEQIVTKVQDHETSIHTIVRVQDKLGGAVDKLNDTMSDIKDTLKELQKEQRRILEIEQKILNFSEVKENVLKRLSDVENRQTGNGCHSLGYIDKRVMELEIIVKKVVWGVFMAFGSALLGLVLNLK